MVAFSEGRPADGPPSVRLHGYEEDAARQSRTTVCASVAVPGTESLAATITPVVSATVDEIGGGEIRAAGNPGRNTPLGMTAAGATCRTTGGTAVRGRSGTIHRVEPNPVERGMVWVQNGGTTPG